MPIFPVKEEDMTKIKTLFRPSHVTISMNDTEYCGNSWCNGSCKYPALIIPANDKHPELKVMSSVVAVGRACQAWRVEWKGEKVAVPEADREWLLGKMWW
jgi:hypothetical protein